MALKAAGYTLVSGEDYTETDDNPMDHNGHGTHVAGIVGAVTNNSTGVAGMMWNCKIVPLRAGCSVKIGQLSPSVIFTQADIAFAIYWSAGWGVHILNMSFSGREDRLLAVKDAIDNGYDVWGQVFVASAGNTGSNEQRYPASWPKVIAVGGTDFNDNKHPWATYGTQLAAAAPFNAYSTVYDVNDLLPPYGSVHDYAWFAGTSQAAPLVSGLAGLILSVNPSLARSNPAKVRDLIINNADKVGGYNYNWDPSRPGHSLELGYGRINAYRTLIAARGSYRSQEDRMSPSIALSGEPLKLSLENYPNPFNPTTTVLFTVPENGKVLLAVYDMLGRLIATLKDEHLTAGSYSAQFDGSTLPSGVYFYRLHANGKVLTCKMLVLK